MMKILVLLALLGLHGAAAVSHTLQYFYTGSTGMKTFPEFVAVGIVDGEQIDYFDSVSEKNVLKQTWMEGVRDESNIENTRRGIQQNFKTNVGIAMQRFNQTTGVHIVQWMYGCEWDSETQEVTAYHQYGYDGEDFIALDLKTEAWIAPKPQAVITKLKWEERKDHVRQKQYYFQICPDWLKKYVEYGKNSLMRKAPPSVSLLQKTPSSPVSCHATGFYPNKAVMFWRKNGEELHEDVDQGEILPNHDGSFQMTVDLDVSSVKPEDWRSYDCVFQLSGLEDDVTKLDKTKIRTNESSIPLIGIIIAVVVLLALVIGAVGFFIYRKNSAKRPPSPPPKQDQGVMEQLNPPTV